MKDNQLKDKLLEDFLKVKPQHAVDLFFHLAKVLTTFGVVYIKAKKTMIAFEAGKSFVWVVYFGKDFLDVVIPFNEKFEHNSCFYKIKTVPGTNQHNHYIRMYFVEDLNNEVISYLFKAFNNKE